MIEVEQSRLGGDVGNCFEAAVASVLECAIDEVPAWMPDEWDDYMPVLNEWLAERGLVMWAVAVLPESLPLSEIAPSLPPTTCIVGVRTVASWNHALIVRAGAVVWDPSPFRDNPVGLKGGHDPHVDFAFVLLPLDPARLATSRT